MAPEPATVVAAEQTTRHAWIDASAGVAGDMLLGALLAAGADLAAVQAAVDAVVDNSVRLTAADVIRCGQRATKLTVEVLAADQPHRRWADIRERLLSASLATSVRDQALATFGRLADAEAEAHGIPADQVHFHEVGALDSIADVVGVAAALADLKVSSVSASAVAVGSGRVRTAHGDLPVPVPAVVCLAAGWQVFAGGVGELATPTGMALVTTLSATCEGLPAMVLRQSGAGAGTKDPPDRPNITRVLIGDRDPGSVVSSGMVSGGVEQLALLETNVDDLDPRVWPGVIDQLLRAGAADAWLVPITMKKGRPAHVLSVLCQPGLVGQLQDLIIDQTSTLGVRSSAVARTALSRGWATVVVAGHPIRIKIGYDASGIRQVNPEFEDVARLARTTGRSEREMIEAARTAAQAAGLVTGEVVPKLD